MEKNIELAIEKEKEYINRRINLGDNTANIYEYIGEAGYDDLEEFRYDKYFYLLKCGGIVSVTDSATVLQPQAYHCYQNGIQFCYFVEYDKKFALVPLSFSKENEAIFNEHGFDCFKCGYDTNGGIILTDPNDFRFCIAIPKPDTNTCDRYFFTELYKYLTIYYPELTIDGNDFMYDGKKVGGSVYFNTDKLFIFAINISIVDMYKYAKELDIIKTKIPGCLPHIDGLKTNLKSFVESWLKR